jgi:hypothetical protein
LLVLDEYPVLRESDPSIDGILRALALTAADVFA